MATIQCTVQRSNWYEVYFEYSYTQDKANATTTLSHSLKLKQLTDSYDFDTVASVTVGYKVAGVSFSKTGRIDINDKGNKGYTITLASGTSTITHNQSTGEGSFTVSVDTSIDSAGYGPGTIKLASKTVSLPTIYRASKPSVSASSVKMGGSVVISTNSKSSSFHHSITVTLGSYTLNWPKIYVNTTWDVGDLAKYMPNALSGTATITCVTYNGSTKIGTETCTITVTVPDASHPAASNTVMGNKATVVTNRSSTNFTHTIELWFAGAKISTKTEVGESTAFDVPLSLATKIPSDPKGTATIKCITYNGTAKVGEDQTTFVATVPDNTTTQPQFTESGFVLTPVGSLPSDFSGMFIQNKTGVEASFTAKSNYSAISKHELEADGRVYTGNPATSRVITTDGNIRVKGIVTDARGYYKEVPKTITVHPYKTPTLEPCEGYSSVICERSTQDGTYDDAGIFLHIKCKLNYAPLVIDNLQRNSCFVTYQTKVGDGAFGNEEELFFSGDSTQVDIDLVLPNVVSQTDKSYTIKIIVRDSIGSEEPYYFSIPTADVTMHLGKGGYGVAFGKYSEATADNKMVELDDDWDLVMSGEAVKDFIVEQGTSGNWEYRKWASGKAECWGRFSVDADVNIPWGSLYIARINEIAFPITFSATPICVYGGTGGTTLMIANNGNATPTSTQPIVLIRPSVTEKTTYLIQFVAYGRWK